MPVVKYCNDCEADITADPLTYECPQRRARLALVEMGAYTLWAVLWSIAMGIACILAAHSASQGGVAKSALFVILSVIAFACSRRASRRADEWAERAKRELEVEK